MTRSEHPSPTFSRTRSRSKKGPLALALGAVMLGSLLVAPVAHAGVGLGGVQSYPDIVTVGQTNVPAFFDFVNQATAPDNTQPLLVNSIELVPSCQSPLPAFCPPASFDPGVFSNPASALGPNTAIGRVGTACAGINFTITTVNAANGHISFNPSAPILLGPPTPANDTDRCIIDFTINVLKSPIGDSQPGLPGIQTTQYGEVRATNTVTDIPGRSTGTSSTTILPRATTGTPPPTANAELTTPGACPKGSATLSVSGTNITDVSFFLDGKKLGKTDTSAPYNAKVNVNKLKIGAHTVKAVVNFSAASGKPKTTLTGRIVRCKPPKPKFTG